ncbi:MAG TPA: FAD-dependent oxidoreductase, partial [Gemmataceae bacterium]
MTGRTWDAIVIGAGPAGSIAARQLARRGASVLLVDKATFPRSKVCGCCLNGAALAALGAIGLDHIPKVCGGIPLRTTRLAAGKRYAELRMDAGVALSREALDSALIREAEAAGATFLPGMLAKIDAAGEGLRAVSLNGGKQLARIAIEATGLGGRAATVRPASRLGAGTIVPREVVPDFFSPGTVYMATGQGGYVGIVRLEDGRLDFGAALDAAFVRSAGGLGPAAASIIATTDWPAVTGLAEFVWKGTPALTRQPEVVAASRLFRVGDAAGYVEPFTGEGMAW